MDDLKTADFWGKVAAMVEALAPVKQVTEALGGEGYISVSIVCCTIANLITTLNRASKISRDLAGAVKLRFLPWFKPGIATAAALLDPKTTALASYFPATVEVSDTEHLTVGDVINASWDRLRMDALYFAADIKDKKFPRWKDERFAAFLEDAVGDLRAVR